MALWMVIYLLHYPNYQDIIFDEIYANKGQQDVVTLGDKPSLPHTEAFISEVFRVVSPVRLGVMNKPRKNTVFRGYNIPSTVGIIACYGSALMDEKYFPDPSSFKPERFVSGGKYKHLAGFVPFGIGRRYVRWRILGYEQFVSAYYRISAEIQNTAQHRWAT
jgi:methyl farnesoate epoxidase/farnesoate epoxidase